MLNRRSLFGALGAIAALLAFGAAQAVAGPEVNTAPGKVLVGGKPAPGLALHGFDPVAYFTVGKPVQGEAALAVVHKDATYRFSSKANLDEFANNPDKYAPQYGGYCAYGAAVGAKFDGDPRFWKIVDGKLYLNLSNEIQTEWNKDIAGYVKKGDANWKDLASKQ